MNLRRQNVIFFLFLATFLIAAPLVTIMTSGFRYSFERHRWEKTGVLQIDAFPGGTTAHINSLGITKKNPATVSRLLADRYEVTVEKPGYTSWTKNVVVRSGQTTFIDRIVLFKNETPTNLLEENILAIGVADTGWTIIATKKDNHVELWQTYGDKPTFLAKLPDATISPNTSIRISFSTDNTIIFLGNVDGTHLAIVPIYAPNSPITVTRAGCKKILPFPDGDNLACLTAKGTLTTLTTTGEILDSINITNTFDIGRWHNRLVAINRVGSQNMLWEFSAHAAKQLTTIPREIEKIGVTTPNTLLLHDTREQNTLVIHSDRIDSHVLLPFQITGVTKEKNAPYVIWNDNEIYTMDDGDFTTTLITRITTPIIHAFSTGRGNAVVYVTSSTIRATETDARNQPLTTTLSEIVDTDIAQSYGTNIYFASHNPAHPGLFVRHIR